MYVCICSAVTEGDIRQAVDKGARSMRELYKELEIAITCGCCAKCAKSILTEAVQERG